MSHANRSAAARGPAADQRYDGARGLLPGDAVTLHLTIPAALPGDIDAIVFEQDTAGVLVDDGRVRPARASYQRLVAAMLRRRPARQGAVIVREGTPLRLYAVVHDLDHEPSWNEAAIRGTLHLVFATVRERGIRSLALPVLGAVHGRLPVERFGVLLASAWRQAQPATLRALWLLAEPPQLPRLHSVALARAPRARF
jgi:hypothetical protein